MNSSMIYVYSVTASVGIRYRVLGIGYFWYVGMWVVGCLGVWVVGCLGIWVFGYLGIWVFGSVGYVCSCL